MYRILCLLLVINIAGCAGGDCSGVYELEQGGRYEKHMKAAQAWALCETSTQEREKYRFVWLRSHDNPVIVTLIKDRLSAEVNATRLDGTGAGEPGETIEMRGAVISLDEFGVFKTYIDGMDFWNMKSRAQLISAGSAEAGGEDSRWILEGAMHDKAHAVDRGSQVYGNFREAALFLVGKTGININGEVY